MNKQVCFFITQKDVDFLISYIYSLDAFLIDYAGELLTKQATAFIADYSYCQTHFGYNNFLITKPNFSLSYRTASGKPEVDQYVSEVIEFSLCTPIPKKIIDTSSVDEKFRKGGVIVIDDSEKYHCLMRELMLDPPYVENPNYIENGFEHARFWYSPTFFTSDNNVVRKSKKSDALFNNLKTVIKENFKLSKDKFAYIGPDAYEKYLLGTFIPCSGRNRLVF